MSLKLKLAHCGPWIAIIMCMITVFLTTHTGAGIHVTDTVRFHTSALASSLLILANTEIFKTLSDEFVLLFKLHFC